MTGLARFSKRNPGAVSRGQKAVSGWKPGSRRRQKKGSGTKPRGSLSQPPRSRPVPFGGQASVREKLPLNLSTLTRNTQENSTPLPRRGEQNNWSRLAARAQPGLARRHHRPDGAGRTGRLPGEPGRGVSAIRGMVCAPSARRSAQELAGTKAGPSCFRPSTPAARCTQSARAGVEQARRRGIRQAQQRRRATVAMQAARRAGGARRGANGERVCGMGVNDVR